MPDPEAAFLDDLTALLGAAGRRDDPAGVVIRPGTTDEVAAVVRRCAAAAVAIVPLGGDTGRSGGTRRPRDRASVAVSLERLRGIGPVDGEANTVVAEAGATIEAVQEAAAAAGRRFAPDWGARGTATVGGAIATNAGGINVVRDGSFRAHVLGLEVVLADGRVWDGMRGLRKDATGYDLAQLFIGSEGTLGLVTRAVLGLRPATPHEQSALAALAGLDHLAPVLALAHRAAGERLSAIELVPGTGIDHFVARTGAARPIATTADHYLLIRLADVAPVTDTLTALLATAVDAGHALDAVVAATPEQEAELWTLRDELSPVLGWPTHEPHALKLDTGVPVGRVAEFVAGVHARASELAPMAHCYAFGHVGDGNIHVSILPITDDAVAPFLRVRDELADRLDRYVLDLGGTLSAEHGIGTLLRDRITPQKPAVEWELMRRIKQALDPHDVFNPGVMFPSP